MTQMSNSSKFASVSLNPREQSLESLHDLMAQIVGRGGCLGCGRVAYLRVDFVGDPPTGFNQGVISFNEQGLRGE